MTRASMGLAAGLAAAAAVGIYTISKTWWKNRKETRTVFKEEVKSFMEGVMTCINNDQDVDDYPGPPSEGTGKTALDLLHTYAGDMSSLLRAERLAAALRRLGVAVLNTHEDPGSPKSPRGMQRSAPTSHTDNADAYDADVDDADAYKADACSSRRRGPNVVDQAAERDKNMRSGPRWQSLQPQPISAVS